MKLQYTCRQRSCNLQSNMQHSAIRCVGNPTSCQPASPLLCSNTQSPAAAALFLGLSIGLLALILVAFTACHRCARIQPVPTPEPPPAPADHAVDPAKGARGVDGAVVATGCAYFAGPAAPLDTSVPFPPVLPLDEESQVEWPVVVVEPDRSLSIGFEVKLEFSSDEEGEQEASAADPPSAASLPSASLPAATGDNRSPEATGSPGAGAGIGIPAGAATSRRRRRWLSITRRLPSLLHWRA